MEFTFTRDLMYFLVQSYIPAIIIVVLSWVSFWIIPDRGRATVAEVATSRAYIGVTGVLSMILVMNTSKTVLPNVDNLNAVDVYFFVSFVYVLAALVEFITVHFLNKQKRKWLERRQRMKFLQKSIVINPDSSSEDEVQIKETSFVGRSNGRSHTRTVATTNNVARKTVSISGDPSSVHTTMLLRQSSSVPPTRTRSSLGTVKFMPPQHRPGRHPISNWRDNASPHRYPIVPPPAMQENNLMVPYSGIELQLKPVHFDHSIHFNVSSQLFFFPETKTLVQIDENDSCST